MDLNIDYEIDLGPVREMLNRVGGINDFTEPLDYCAQHMVRSVDLNFAFNGRPTKWQPLAPSTVARKEAMGRSGNNILVFDGHLRNSFQQGKEGNIHEISPNQVVIGTNIEYAHFHQEGHAAKSDRMLPKNGKALFWPGLARPISSARKGALPERPFALFQDEDKEEFQEIFMTWVSEVVAGE